MNKALITKILKILLKDQAEIELYLNGIDRAAEDLYINTFIKYLVDISDNQADIQQIIYRIDTIDPDKLNDPYMKEKIEKVNMPKFMEEYSNNLFDMEIDLVAALAESMDGSQKKEIIDYLDRWISDLDKSQRVEQRYMERLKDKIKSEIEIR